MKVRTINLKLQSLSNQECELQVRLKIQANRDNFFIYEQQKIVYFLLLVHCLKQILLFVHRLEKVIYTSSQYRKC